MKYKLIPIRTCLLFAFGILQILACKKSNLDYTYDYRRQQEAMTSSNVRLVNLSLNNQLIANGDSLTNFFLAPRRPGGVPPEEATPPGTHYFPSNGRLGQTWNIPRELFQQDGTINLKTTWVAYNTNPIPSHDVELSVKESYEQPKDYYLLMNNEVEMQDATKLLEVPRGITAPAKPDHFKIRVLNLSRKLIGSTMEDLFSELSLVYADGSPVSTATSGIAVNKWSEYVEVPYGTYQFKVLTNNGRQIPASGQSYYSYINRANSTMEMLGPNSADVSSGLTFAPINTFQPGGVYTIVIHPTSFTWTNGLDDQSNLQNAVRIVADIAEPQNLNYTQIQLANTTSQELNLQLAGQSTGTTGSGSASDYKRLIAGRQVLELKSAAGQTLLSEEVELLAGQNYTYWIYADQNNQLKAMMAANNLAGTVYTGNGKDGTNGTLDRYDSQFFFNFRFLNFCSQVPYATFTNGDGMPFSGNLKTGSGINVQPGILKTTEPYSSVTYNHSSSQTGGAYQFMAYSSAPALVPGNWLKQVAPIPSDQLIANKDLYTSAGRKVPAHEPGVYSIALIGDLNKGNTAEKARFMVIKHTK